MSTDQRKELVRGTRLRMTAKALKQGLDGNMHRRTGAYYGLGRRPCTIRVLRDGTKTPERYHKDFWEIG